MFSPGHVLIHVTGSTYPSSWTKSRGEKSKFVYSHKSKYQPRSGGARRHTHIYKHIPTSEGL